MERRLRLLGAVGKFHHRMCKKHLCLGVIHLGDLQEKAPVRVLFFMGWIMGLEESGPPAGRVKKCPVDTFLARGRVPWLSGRSP